ncbi:hypothetical protein ACFWNB_10510, partial [Kitasatospora purpeofusca]
LHAERRPQGVFRDRIGDGRTPAALDPERPETPAVRPPLPVDVRTGSPFGSPGRHAARRRRPGGGPPTIDPVSVIVLGFEVAATITAIHQAVPQGR